MAVTNLWWKSEGKQSGGSVGISSSSLDATLETKDSLRPEGTTSSMTSGIPTFQSTTFWSVVGGWHSPLPAREATTEAATAAVAAESSGAVSSGGNSGSEFRGTSIHGLAISTMGHKGLSGCSGDGLYMDSRCTFVSKLSGFKFAAKLHKNQSRHFSFTSFSLLSTAFFFFFFLKHLIIDPSRFFFFIFFSESNDRIRKNSNWIYSEARLVSKSINSFEGLSRWVYLILSANKESLGLRMRSGSGHMALQLSDRHDSDWRCWSISLVEFWFFWSLLMMTAAEATAAMSTLCTFSSELMLTSVLVALAMKRIFLSPSTSFESSWISLENGWSFNF